MMDTLTKELYEEVTNLLHDMGTPAHIKGHYYLRSAILEVYAHPELLKNMMNGLYATIAEAYDTTPSCVERSIRNAVEATLDRGDVACFVLLAECMAAVRDALLQRSSECTVSCFRNASPL